MVELPGQKLSVPVIIGFGREESETLTDFFPLHKLPSVTVTEYVPAELTLIICEVAAVDQR